MIRYFIICEKDGYIVKDYYMVDSAKEAMEEFEKEYASEGYELTMLFKGE
jgi:hypothetical protein